MLRSKPHDADADRLTEAALHLKPRQRVRLVERLMESLEPEDAEFDAMLTRRFKEMQSGAVKGHSAQESLDIARRGMRRKH